MSGDLSEAVALVDRIKSGECQVQSLGHCGKIVGLVVETNSPMSAAGYAAIHDQLQQFKELAGLNVPVAVLGCGVKLMAVCEVPA